jgi:branched-chain amino acid transport system permease protein
MNVTTIFILHGLVYAGLLFLVSSGLTLVFGMMNVLNFAHASFYMLAAYFSYSLLRWTGNFWLCLLVCPFLLFAIGALIERFLLRRVHVFGHLHELLLTFGIAFIISEAVKWVWGTAPLPIQIGGFLDGNVTVRGVIYPTYRFFVLVCSILIGLLMSLLLLKTRMGITVRSAVDDSEMVNALGVNTPLVFMFVFALGAALSGLAGVISGPLLSINTGMATAILVDAFVVIVIGGFGSLIGAVVASLMIGQLQSFGALLFPKISLALIYLLMAIVLIAKPSGLFGEKK